MLDFVLIITTLALTAITLLYGAACRLLMRADTTRDHNAEP